MPSPTVIAIDWSGRAKGAAEAIWLAEVRGGKLIDLRSGHTADQVVAELCAQPADASLIVGLDFAFSFPAWWCEEQGWEDIRDVWHGALDRADSWLEGCPPPFWGRAGKANQLERARLFRKTDREITRGTPKSVFQIGGAGAVGTGSIRGMPHLLTLAEAGFAVWPFENATARTVIEIYPRAFTRRPVHKSSWRQRHAYVFEHLRGQPPELLERAAGSEDAFDAAVSALGMAAAPDRIARLPQLSEPYSIEGCIWSPDGIP